MSAMAPIIHALFVVADQCEKLCDEMPASVCDDQRIMLSAIASVASRTAEQLKEEIREREARLMEPTHG